jgi:uncharacterized membrane protein
MEELFVRVSSGVALLVEAGSVLLIAVGSIEALVRTFVSYFQPATLADKKKRIWTRYAMWLLLGLEFLLAADIIRTAVAPTWNDIGQLAAIAAIRTFLNFFLTRDIEEFEAQNPAGG